MLSLALEGEGLLQQSLMHLEITQQLLQREKSRDAAGAYRCFIRMKLTRCRS
jgi:hypothetical protein